MALHNNDIEIVRLIVNSRNFVKPPQGSDIYRVGNDNTRREFNEMLYQHTKSRLPNRLTVPGVREHMNKFF